MRNLLTAIHPILKLLDWDPSNAGAKLRAELYRVDDFFEHNKKPRKIEQFTDRRLLIDVALSSDQRVFHPP
jgi:hypothetical protein